MKLNIKYKRKRSYLNLFLAFAWFSYGIFLLNSSEELNLFDLGWFILAIIYFVIFVFKYPSEYLKIENGVLKQNWLLGKKIKLKEIINISHLEGILTLKTRRSQIKINIEAIEKQSYQLLESELRKLNIEWSI